MAKKIASPDIANRPADGLVPPELASIVSPEGNPQVPPMLADAIVPSGQAPKLAPQAQPEIPQFLSDAINQPPVDFPELAPVGERKWNVNTTDQQRKAVGSLNGPTAKPSPEAGETYKKMGTREKIGNALNTLAPQFEKIGAQYSSPQRQNFYLQSHEQEMMEPYRQAQIDEIQSQAEARKAQMELARQSTPITLANGQTVYVPRKDAASIFKQQEANAGRSDVAETTANSRERVAEINQGGGVPVDPAIAKVIGMPELAGVKVGKGTLANINAMLKAQNYATKDLGPEGVWVVDRVGNKIAQVGASPSYSRAQMMGPRVVQTTDGKGNPIYMPTSQAAGMPVAQLDPQIAAKKALGVSLATGTEGDQIQSYRAFMGHLNDMADASQQFINSGSPYANKAINWLRMHAAGDPKVAAYLAKLAPVKKEYESFLLNNRALYSEDRIEGNTILDENKTPQQVAEVAKSMAHTGAIRIGSANLRYRDTFGEDNPTLLDPETTRLLEKYGQMDTMQRYQNPNAKPAPPKANQRPQPSTKVETWVRGADGKYHPQGAK